ncbi:MAG TPA: hypothetical protein VGN64_15710 [Dyadobacter sp.]|nr:hypothetical protein [Dyadobacter sp.]
MITLISLVIIFHLAVIISLIPYDIVWAGKINTQREMYTFESVSIAVNILLLVTLILKKEYIKNGVSQSILDLLLWIFVVVFLLNTVGNLMAETLFERWVFSPLTLLFAVLLWVIVRREGPLRG